MTSSFKFDCVFYHVGDLERAIRFYADGLGLRLSSRDAVARFHIDGVLVELVPTSDPLVLWQYAAAAGSGPGAGPHGA